MVEDFWKIMGTIIRVIMYKIFNMAGQVIQ